MHRVFNSPVHARSASNSEASHMGTDSTGDNLVLTFTDDAGTLQAVHAPIDDVLECVALILRHRREGGRHVRA